MSLVDWRKILNDKEPLFKFFYRNLCIEVTRKCNMKCEHCMRGEAQNHSISKEVVDRIFEEVSAIGELLLTGGEPFLEPEMIDYIVESIIKNKIPIMNIQIVTNGLIRNKSIVGSINKLTEYIANANWGKKLDRKQLRTIGSIKVSNDDFHSKYDIMETLKFYREYLNEHTIITKENLKKDTEMEDICYLGNATKESFKLKDNQRFRYLITPYRVSFLYDDGKPIAIETMIQIGWDGKVLIGQDSSYEQQDRNNYGNILDKHISTLFKDGAFEEPFTETEAHKHDMIYSMYKNKRFNEVEGIDEDFCKLFLWIFEAVYCERERIHKTYRQLDFEELVEVAYHDMNVSLKETYGEDTDFYRLDTLKLFNTPKEESEKILANLKAKYPLEFFIGYFKYWNRPLEPIPDSITRERYVRFEK